MKNKNYNIKTMNRQEVDIAIEWAAKEGWNPGLYDADCYYSADPNGFLIGTLDNEPIAAISAVKYGGSFGFMGFYIVKPEYRGKGYGIQIWNAGLDYLKEVTIGLDGVVAQQNNYKKSGFNMAFRNIRYEGTGGGTPPVNSGIIKLSSIPFEKINSYNQPFFPAKRSRFLEFWINQPECSALGIIKNDDLAGYGVIRKCRCGYKIGPLFADSMEFTEHLFLGLKSGVDPTETVFLDIPEVNGQAVALTEKHNMKVVFETARMYKGESPDMPLDRIFGMTSFEIG